MSVTDLPLLNQIKGRLGWLDDRQRVIAQNVANSDTPGYVARDLKTPTDFAEAMRTGGGLRMTATNARHISPPGQAARFEATRAPDSETTLDGTANILICPNLDAANILFNVLKMTGGQGVTVGPILLGAAKPVHILTPSATVRRIVNMTAVAVAHGTV